MSINNNNNNNKKKKKKKKKRKRRKVQVGWKEEAFQVGCNEQGPGGNAFRMGSSNL